MISIDTLTLTLIVGSVIPLLVGLITKSTAAPSVKSIINIVLTGVAGAATALLNSDHGLRWQSVLIAAFATYIASGTTYNHAWKPLGIAGTDSQAGPGMIDRKTGNAGVG